MTPDSGLNADVGRQNRGSLMVLRDSIEVAADISAFFGFFDGMTNERYLSWHPDHN
jgi:hypothetical protein